MIFELCTDSVEGAIAADKFGAQRIELCSALSVGGLTPSFGLIQQCAIKSNVEVHVMIRHKEGGFNYDLDDVELMKNDIKAAKEAGAHGVVFGILTENNEISKLNKGLVDLSRSLKLEVTFHRAFDFVPDCERAIIQIIDMGFDRLLTSGLQPTALQGLQLIKKIQADHGSEIQIMAGSGVNASNAVKIAASGISNLHFTARKSLDTSTKLSMGELMITDNDKIKNIIDQFGPDHS